MKTTPKPKLWLVTPVAVATLGLSAITLAITPEEGRETFIWQGFQGGAENKGHIPVSLIVDDTPDKVEGWPMQAYLTHPTPAADQYGFYHANGNTITSTSAFLQFHQNLNQPTVTEDAVVVSNRGYITPFEITHTDRASHVVSDFDYLFLEVDYVTDSGTDLQYLDDIYCTQSQSQVVFHDDVAYVATNYYELSSEDRLCDPTIDTPDSQFTHLRAHPIRPDKDSAGGEELEIVNGERNRLAITAHHKDQFLSPNIAGSEVFSQGGGVQSVRDHTGVYSYSNIGTSAEVSIQNNWASANARGYVTVAPNSFWSPVVTSTKVLTFLNGTTSEDYRDNVPTLTEIDRTTGAVESTRIQQLNSIDFISTEESSFNVFNMATAPVAADDNTIVVINNNNLIFFDITDSFFAAPEPINGGFYGQPVIAGDVVYALSRDAAACGGSASCIRAFSVTASAPIKDSNDDDWMWAPPSATEELDFPFVTTDSHLFVSSDAGNTYGVNSARDIANANRLEMTYPLNGKLAFSYDTLFIAHSAPDVTASTYSDLRLARPFVETTDVAGLNASLQSAWATHNTDRAGFAAAVKGNRASVVAALQFPLDGTQVADIDVDLSVTAPSVGATTAEVDQVITYQAVVTNRGSLPATNVVATARIPGAVNLEGNYQGPVSCSFARSILTCELDGDLSSNENTLAVGASVTFSFDVVPQLRSRIDMTVAADGTELNPDDPTLDTDDNSATVTVESVAASPSDHDLSVAITSNEYEVDLGRNITYTIAVTNLAELSSAPGTASATAIDVRVDFAVQDTNIERVVAAGNCTLTNCTIDRLAAGETQSFTIETTTLASGQGGLNAQAASTRDEQTDVALSDNSAVFSSTQVSTTVSVEAVTELPKASGSTSIKMLFAGFLLLLSGALKKKRGGITRFSHE